MSPVFTCGLGLCQDQSMRNAICGILLTAVLVACLPPPEAPKMAAPPPYDLEGDVDLYLSTNDPQVEQEALARLNKQNTPHNAVKQYLKQVGRGTGGTPGLHTDLEYSNGDQTYPYALYAPELEAGRDYPMIVILHGMGGSGDRTVKSWLPRLKDEDFIILCPSYPAGAWWSLRAEEMVMDLIQSVKRQYPVDHNRVFLAGLSNGAIGAYMTGMFYPDHFAGIVPIAGAITDRYLHFLVNLKNTPIYSIQGVHDPIFPIQYSRRIRKILNDLQYTIEYREHREQGMAHGGHFLPDSEVPPLVEWLKKTRRDPHPHILRMVREENHLDNIHWAQVTRGLQMAALQLPGPEKENMNIRDGKITTLLAVHKEPNLFEIVAKNLLEHEVYLNAEQVDFDKKFLVTFQELSEQNGKFVTGPQRVSFHEKVEPDLEVLLSGFKRRWDPELLYDARITINLEEKVQFASVP